MPRPRSLAVVDDVHPGEVLVQAARQGDADRVLHAGGCIALADADLAGSCAGQIVKAMLHCHPQAIPALAFALSEIASRHGRASDTLTASVLRHMPRDSDGIKVMSVMAAAGFDLAGCDDTLGDVPDLRAHHAHLAGVEKETVDDLCALLERSSLEGFHGRSYGRFPGDLALWRPLIHGRYGVLWALPPVLGLVALGATALGMVVQGILS